MAFVLFLALFFLIFKRPRVIRQLETGTLTSLSHPVPVASGSGKEKEMDSELLAGIKPLLEIGVVTILVMLALIAILLVIQFKEEQGG